MSSPAQRQHGPAVRGYGRVRRTMPLRGTFRLRPVADTWRWSALSALIAIGVPEVVLLAVGHLELAFYTCAGGLCALYAHGLPYAARARALAWVVAGMVAGTGVALATAALTESAAVRVAVIALLAGVFKVVCDATRIGPPGNVILTFVTATAAFLPTRLTDLPWHLTLVLAGGVLAWLVCLAPSLIRPHGPERRAVARALESTARLLSADDPAAPRLRYETAAAVQAAWHALRLVPARTTARAAELEALAHLVVRAESLAAAAHRHPPGSLRTSAPRSGEAAAFEDSHAVAPRPDRAVAHDSSHAGTPRTDTAGAAGGTSGKGASVFPPSLRRAVGRNLAARCGSRPDACRDDEGRPSLDVPGRAPGDVPGRATGSRAGVSQSNPAEVLEGWAGALRGGHPVPVVDRVAGEDAEVLGLAVERAADRRDRGLRRVARAFAPSSPLFPIGARVAIGSAAAGWASMALGVDRPYWAVVTAAAVYVANTALTWQRAVQRVLGNLGGVLLFTALVPLLRSAAVLVLVALACQLVVEATISRNYALATVFVTPMALVMTEFALRHPARELVADRWLDTCVGAAVGMLVCLAIPNRRVTGRVDAALRTVDAAMVQARTPDGRLAARERLAAALIELREASDTASGEWWSAPVPQERVVAAERTGHRLLAELSPRPVTVR